MDKIQCKESVTQKKVLSSPLKDSCSFYEERFNRVPFTKPFRRIYKPSKKQLNRPFLFSLKVNIYCTGQKFGQTF